MLDVTRSDPTTAARNWLAAFETALGDGGDAAALFLPDGHWRDLLAFTWRIDTFTGREAIGAALAPGATDFELDPARSTPATVTH